MFCCNIEIVLDFIIIVVCVENDVPIERSVDLSLYEKK